MTDSFQFFSLPKINFGTGKRSELADEVNSRGKRVLLLTGSSSVHNSGHGDQIITSLKAANLELEHEVIAHEPSPLSLIHISEPTRPPSTSRMPSSA